MDNATISELKKGVLKSYKGNWGGVIKANIIPIVTSIMTGFSISLAALVGILNSKAISHAIENPTDSMSAQFTSGFQAASNFLWTAIVAFIAVGIQYGILDLLKRKNQPIGFRTAFQAFTKKYFVSKLAIYILQFIFFIGWGILSIPTLGILYLVKTLAYSQSYLIYKDATDLGVADKYEYVNFITFSRRLMDGNKWRFFLVQLSTFGWWLLGAVTFGIAFIWVTPYQTGVFTNFYKDLAEKQGAKKVSEVFGTITE
ncbi:DUF975 family protein [Pediococcus argentinicus]|uniref:Integral membrane protein n=1 Tax=Pediococcus argentinicus TaxID=480391 RepID=A0A0R2NG49_9LACO|nr:DUF975 family protein [Pediococcus argentinicus]KRO24773.1 integral membrane protein [Pediococcus argentinicus]NKZ22729.1 DUF975 family protein [Pediococcus argentinicus]GEP19775.1 membrane protein [Pediococcus argentinicus]